jgi:hypothetical protein
MATLGGVGCVGFSSIDNPLNPVIMSNSAPALLFFSIGTLPSGNFSTFQQEYSR